MDLYDRLAPWYHLLDPVEDHAEEVAVYRTVFDRTARGSVGDLLELGAGAGNGLFHLRQRYRCTAADLSPAMIELSRARNPDCAHHVGDMRTLRLDRTFDAVLIHDAIGHMTTREDLRAALETAFTHLRPGGAAIFAPDDLRETLAEASELVEGDDGVRALRGVIWSWDPDPNDETAITEYAFLLREGGSVHVAHDRHVDGVFARAVWLDLLRSVGFVEVSECAGSSDDARRIFVARR
jgi:SAM-dependent methyltransferase